MEDIMSNDKATIDESYNIREYEVDDSWKKDLYSEEYQKYRENWDKATNDYVLFENPLFLEIETSYACNYKCPYCPQVTLPEMPSGGLMKAEIIDKLFSEVEERQIPSISLSHGGEPLIRKDIPQLIKRLKDIGVHDRMFHTNASLLTKDLSEAVIESGITKINFSLDAVTSETYNKVRVGGEYDDVVSNVMSFLEAKKRFGKSYPRTRVSFVVSDLNRHEMQPFFDFWKDKVNMITFQQQYDFSSVKDEQLLKEAQGKKVAPCSLLWQHLNIMYGGEITCMHDYNHDNILGNVKTHTIHECWNSDEMNSFRDLHKNNKWCDIKMCQKCVSRVQSINEDDEK